MSKNRTDLVRPGGLLCVSAGPLALLLVVGLFSIAGAGEEDRENGEKTDEQVETKTLVTNLQNPFGIAVHPETGHIFLASRYGIHRYVPDTNTARLEVTGYPTGTYGREPEYEIGPLSVAFLDNEHLIVGDGSRPQGEEVVRIYKIGPEPPEESRQEDEAEHTLGPIEAGKHSADGENNFHGVAVAAGALFVTASGDPAKGWIARAEIKDGQPGELSPFIATKVATKVGAPGPIVVHPESGELVVGQRGEMHVAGNSLLAFYDPETGELNKTLKTGLNEIFGIAYSPKTEKLYVTDFASINSSQGGLFRLDIDGDEVTATKVLSLDKPTAATFDQEGRLYITVFNTPDEDHDHLPGELLVIDAGL